MIRAKKMRVRTPQRADGECAVIEQQRTDDRERRQQWRDCTSDAILRYLLPAGSVEKRTRVNSSGMCESHTPCGLHAQPPGSFAGGASLYWLNREKSMRHSSPSRGG